MAKVIKALAAVSAMALAFGCSTTNTGGGVTTPTHSWFANVDVSTAKYNLHNKQCVDETKVDVQEMSKSTPEFTAYERCMNAKGYTLVAAVR